MKPVFAKTWLLIPVLFFAFQPGLFAQNSALRVLAISEDEGTPVVAANVLLTISGADTLHARATDAYGFVEFSNIAPQTYEIHISFIGYETHRNIITLEPGEIRIYRPELATDTAVLGELVVSVRTGAVRREAGLQTITPEDLSRMPTPAPGGYLTMYLQILPGVVTTGDRGGEIHIRGGTPSQNLVLVENMPVIKPFHISNLFSAIPQNVLSTVDVYAGGFGSGYSGATSAVLDINLRQGNMRRFQSEAAISPYIFAIQAEGPASRDRQSFLFSGRYSALEQFGPMLTGDDVPLHFYDMIGRYSINWDSIVCNITGLHTYDRGRINPEQGLKLSWSNLAAGVRCLGFSEQLNHAVDLTIGYTGYNSTEVGFDNLSRNSNLNMGYMRLDNRTTFFDLPSNYGFKLEFIHYTALLDDPFAHVMGRTIRYTGLSSELDEIAVNLSVYTATEWQPVSTVSIRPGVVSQINLRDISPTLEPRMRMTWNPNGNDNIQWSFSTGRYVQMHEAIHDERDAGTVFYIYKQVNKRDPYPSSLHAILGYRNQTFNRFGFSIEAYAKTHKNIPVARWTREPANTLETGLAEAFTYGSDIQLELFLDRFFLAASYGIAEVIYEAPSNEIVAWVNRPVFRYNPPHDRRHQINVISTLDFGKYTAKMSWQFSSGNPFTRIYAYDFAFDDQPRQNPLTHLGTARTLFSEPFDGKLPDFYRLDISLGRSFSLTGNTSFDMEIGAVNVLDITNVFYFDVNTLQQVNQLPRFPYFSIVAKFR